MTSNQIRFIIDIIEKHGYCSYKLHRKHTIHCYINCPLKKDLSINLFINDMTSFCYSNNYLVLICAKGILNKLKQEDIFEIVL